MNQMVHGRFWDERVAEKDERQHNNQRRDGNPKLPKLEAFQTQEAELKAAQHLADDYLPDPWEGGRDQAHLA